MPGKLNRWTITAAALLAVALIAATQFFNRVATIDASALLKDARLALTQNNYTSAGELLDRILAQEPQHVGALLERGKLWELVGKYDEALADWDKVAQIEPSSKHMASEALYLIGALNMKLGKAPTAEEAFVKAWQADNQHLPALDHALRLFVLQMRRADILQVLDLISERRTLSLEEMVLRVDAGGAIINASDAIPQLALLVKNDPEDLHSTLALARYYLAGEEYDVAKKMLAEVPVSLSRNSEIIGLHALALLRQSAPERSHEQLKKPRADDRAGYWWWVAASELANEKQEFELAADCLAQAIANEPASGYAHYRYGIALKAAGKDEAAIQQLEIAALFDRLHQNSGVITRMVNMPRAELTSGLLRIAHLLLQLGMPTESARWARLVLEMDPQNADAKSLWQKKDTAKRATVAASETVVRQRVDTWLDRTVIKAGDDTGTPSLTQKTSELQLTDVHSSVGLDFQYFNGNSGSKYLIEAMGGAVSVLDYDMDGWPDAYFPQGGPIPPKPNDFTYLDQLYRNIDGKQFKNITAQTRIVENGYSQGSVTGDVNNDGFPDIVVANYGATRLFINQGDGTYQDATESWGLHHSDMSTSVALADFDRDGALDLYIVNYVDSIRICRDTRGQISTCNPQNFTGVQDRLFRNTGASKWIDVTAQAGVIAPDGKGLGVVASDFDDDGLIDIYVANDTTPNFLFKNLGDMRFQEIGLTSGVALSPEGQAQAGMGIAAADLNGDLLTDLFVTNFYGESNNLYANHGSMIFTDDASPARLSVPSKDMLGFGTQAEDINLDGQLDLIVANGHIDDYSWRNEPWKMPTQVFCNLSGGKFENCTATAGDYFRGQFLGRGVASLDWNRDGKKDFIVVHQDRPVALLQNDTVPLNPSVTLTLMGTAANRDAIGSKVLVTHHGSTLRRDIAGGNGYYSTNEKSICCPAASGEADTRVKVTWPDGSEESHALKGRGEFLLIQQEIAHKLN